MYRAMSNAERQRRFRASHPNYHRQYYMSARQHTAQCEARALLKRAAAAIAAAKDAAAATAPDQSQSGAQLLLWCEA